MSALTIEGIPGRSQIQDTQPEKFPWQKMNLIKSWVEVLRKCWWTVNCFIPKQSFAAVESYRQAALTNESFYISRYEACLLGLPSYCSHTTFPPPQWTKWNTNLTLMNYMLAGNCLISSLSFGWPMISVFSAFYVCHQSVAPTSSVFSCLATVYWVCSFFSSYFYISDMRINTTCKSEHVQFTHK